MREGSNYLDSNRPDAIRLNVEDARALGEPVATTGPLP
jgi:hypothetical protein